MPSKKKGRAAGRASAVDALAPAVEPSPPSPTYPVPSYPAAASKVGSLLDAMPSSPSASSSSAMAKALRQDLGGLGGQASASSSTPPPAGAACGASARDADGEASGEDFQDALEELAPDEGPDESQENPIDALLRKDSSLQKPAPSRPDWAAELRELEQLVRGDAVSDDEKVRLLHEALAQRIEDVKALEEHKTAASRCAEELLKERDRCQKDRQTAEGTKAKLEESCRELQQIKASITQENKRIVEEEKGRQAELNDKFQSAMKDVEEKIKAETEIRDHFIKENEELRTKLNRFTETYEEQEKQLAEQTAARSKEMETARERLKEYETKGSESSTNATALEKKNKALQKTTVALKAELQSILGRFDEFHESVNGSNQKHGECKTEIDGLSARLKDLDQENIELKENVKINELTKEKEQLQKQRDALDRLCSNLQVEIGKIRERVKGPGKIGGC